MGVRRQRSAFTPIEYSHLCLLCRNRAGTDVSPAHSAHHHDDDHTVQVLWFEVKVLCGYQSDDDNHMYITDAVSFIIKGMA